MAGYKLTLNFGTLALHFPSNDDGCSMISFTFQHQLNLISHPIPTTYSPPASQSDSNPPPSPYPILLLFPPQHLLSPSSRPFLFSSTNNLPHRQETSLDSPALNFALRIANRARLCDTKPCRRPCWIRFATIASISGRDWDKFSEMAR
jgi:hypothetical protein